MEEYLQTKVIFEVFFPTCFRSQSVDFLMTVFFFFKAMAGLIFGRYQSPLSVSIIHSTRCRRLVLLLKQTSQLQKKKKFCCHPLECQMAEKLPLLCIGQRCNASTFLCIICCLYIQLLFIVLELFFQDGGQKFDPSILTPDKVNLELEIGPSVMFLYGTCLRHLVHLKVSTFFIREKIDLNFHFVCVTGKSYIMYNSKIS